MRVAAIDIGTNSVLLLVAERRGDGVVALAERATITRLGEGVDRTGKLSDAAIARTLACLEQYAAEATRLAVERVAAVGTSAMRDAGGEAFVGRAARILGVAPQVVSGEREAQLTFAGALVGLDVRGPVAVFDVGGGSTEIIVGAAHAEGAAGPSGRQTDARADAAVSLDVGSVRLTERHVRSDPPAPAELAAVRADVAKALAGAPRIAGLPLVGVAGTVTTLAAYVRGVVPYDGARVHGATLERGELGAAVARLAAMTLAERKRVAAIDEKRADVIVAGGLIVEAVGDAAGADRLLVSDRGVRWGLALELLRGGPENRTNPTS